MKTAVKLITTDIKNLNASNTTYPCSGEMSSVDQALAFIPKLLEIFLENIFVGKDTSLKLASIGQAIIQAARPKAVIAPLQLGLGIQIHHHFASKFLIDSLSSHGFCSPYTVVQKYERSAAVNQGTDIPGYTPDTFVQYVADNVDGALNAMLASKTFNVPLPVKSTKDPGSAESEEVSPACSTTQEPCTDVGLVSQSASIVQV